MCIFQPGNFTGWGSEEVKHKLLLLFYCCCYCYRCFKNIFITIVIFVLFLFLNHFFICFDFWHKLIPGVTISFQICFKLKREMRVWLFWLSDYQVFPPFVRVSLDAGAGRSQLLL